MFAEVFECKVDVLCDPHFHAREGDVTEPLIKLAVDYGTDVLGLMPNTQEGLTTLRQVLDYCGHAQQCAGQQATILPIVMVNEATTIQEVDSCTHHEIRDCKIYPLGRTTKSHNGVRHYGRLLQTIKHCGKSGMKVHMHPEHPWMEFDNRDAEFAFLPIVDMLLNETEATIVWEHGTDARCVPLWKEMSSSGRFYLTLTPHHLVSNEDDAFGDVRVPHANRPSKRGATPVTWCD